MIAQQVRLIRPGLLQEESGSDSCVIDAKDMVIVLLRGILYKEKVNRIEAELYELCSNGKPITLIVDSPGGDVSGIKELHDLLASIKSPKTAIVKGECCSAAYWIASAADRIVATVGSTIGSIGCYVLMMPLDGLEVIRSGKYKATGIDEMTKEQRAELQAYVDSIGNQFRSDVMASRPAVAPDSMDGGAYLARAALERGLIDAIIPSSYNPNERH